MHTNNMTDLLWIHSNQKMSMNAAVDEIQKHEFAFVELKIGEGSSSGSGRKSQWEQTMTERGIPFCE